MLSGRRLDLIDPSPLDVEIADIAHGLARVARWNGQTAGPEIFSVAQHSLLVEALFAGLAPRSPLEGAPRRAFARRARICDRRHDLAVQGGDRRRLPADRGAPHAGDSYPLRPARRAGSGSRQANQGGRPGLRLSRGDDARRLHGRRSPQTVRRAPRLGPGLRKLSGADFGLRRRNGGFSTVLRNSTPPKRSPKQEQILPRDARCRAFTSARSP